MLYLKNDIYKYVKVPKANTNLVCDLLFVSCYGNEEPFFYSSFKSKIIKFIIHQDKTITYENKEQIDYKLYVEEFIKLNYETIIKHFNGETSDKEFLDNLIYIRYSSCSQPSYTSSLRGKIISKDSFLKIKKQIVNDTKLNSDITNHYDLINEYLEFYKKNHEYNDNLLGLYISYFIQRMSYKTMFDKELIHLFADYLRTFHPRSDIELFWSLHDKSLQGDTETAKELAELYWHGSDIPDKDYKKCEYFALISIRSKDRYALFNYAMYLMDIRKDDVLSMRFSLKIFLELTLSSNSVEDYLTILLYISILLCDRKLELNCKKLLDAMITFLYDIYPNEEDDWIIDRINEILTNIAGCFYLGINVEKDNEFARNILSKTNSNYKRTYYLGCIDNPRNSILDSVGADFRKIVGKTGLDSITFVRYCDCKNAYEYHSILLFGDKRFAEAIEQNDRFSRLLEMWKDIKTIISNPVGKNKLSKIFETFISDELA